MMLSLNGLNLMSSTTPAWPQMCGVLASTRPLYNTKVRGQRLKLQTLFFLHMQCVNNVRISNFYKSAKSCKPTFICIREKLHDDHENHNHNCWEYFLISIYHNKSILENIKNVTNATSISKTNIIVDIFEC